MVGRGRSGRQLAHFLLASTPPDLSTYNVSQLIGQLTPTESFTTELLLFVKYTDLFHDIPINNSVRVNGVVEDVGAVADNKLAGGLQVVLS